MFHMLRRQMLQPFRKPLIVMTPKSLLRHELSVSSLEDLTRGGFARVIDEIDELPPQQVRRVVFCSGKVYFDLLEGAPQGQARATSRWCASSSSIPSRARNTRRSSNRYPNAREIVWCQEEPQNQGAWYQIRHRLQEPCVRRPRRCCTRAARRRPRRRPASAKIHEAEQQALVHAALHATATEESARETTRLTGSGAQARCGAGRRAAADSMRKSS